MRYSDKQKADVVAFVKKYNKEKGRGGQTAAKNKFGISPISIANWLTAAGEELPGKGGRKKSSKSTGKAKKRAGRPKGKRPSSSAAAGSLSEKLKRLAEIDREIQTLQAEFDKLKATL